MKAGCEKIIINGKEYIIPHNLLLFKAPNNKDVYLSSIKNISNNTFKPVFICGVKFIEDNRIDEVSFDKIEKYMNNLHKKFYIDKVEYDIPYNMIEEANSIVSKISKYNPLALKDFKKTFQQFRFNKNE